MTTTRFDRGGLDGRRWGVGEPTKQSIFPVVPNVTGFNNHAMNSFGSDGSARGRSNKFKQLAAAVLFGLALTSSVRADVDVPARFADRIPDIDGHVDAGEWSFAAGTVPLIEEELVMYTKNDAEFLYILIDARADTSNEPPNYKLIFDVNQDGGVTYFRDFRYNPGYSVSGEPAPLFQKFYFEPPPPPGEPVIPPLPAAGDPRARAAFGFETTWELEEGVPAHRVCEFRLPLAELGVRPEDLRSPGARVPSVRMRLRYASLDEGLRIVDEPRFGGGPTGFDNMYRIGLAGSATYPAGLTGRWFQGVGLVPAGRIDPNYGTAYMEIANYPYGPLYDAPFGGDLHIRVNFDEVQGTPADKYRVLVSKDGGPFTALRQTWTNLRLPAEDPEAFGPDAEAAYLIRPDMPSASAWYLPNLAMVWHSAGFPDGTYRIKLELTNTVWGLDYTPTGSENNLTLRIVNTPPSVRISRIQYNGEDICECGIVTQGATPRGFTFTISAYDPNGALAGFSFGATYANGQSTNIYSSMSYQLGHMDENGPRRWNGTNDLVLYAADPWRAPRSCAYTFGLSASSRVQDGYRNLFSAATNSSLTILLGSGEGRRDCPSDGPTPSSPMLSIRYEADQVRVSWPIDFADYRLESTMRPEDPKSWVAWKEPIVISGDERFIAIPQGGPLEFFRLVRQP